MRAARLTYLNVAPFHWGCEEWGVELVPCVPRELGRLAARGEVDAGPMAVVDWFALEKDFEPAGPYGIASDGPALSVFLFSTRPIEALQDSVIAVTEETSTSFQLMRVLLEERYGVRPREYRRGAEKGDASLIIGDAALEEAKRRRFEFVYDLGEEWRRWQGLPFVFARWVIRRDLPEAEKKRFARLLESSFEAGMQNLEELARQCAGQGALDAAEIVAYLRNLVYRMGPDEERGLAEFRRLLGRVSTDERGAVRRAHGA
jgi:chorismate dehydratase